MPKNGKIWDLHCWKGGGGVRQEGVGDSKIRDGGDAEWTLKEKEE